MYPFQTSFGMASLSFGKAISLSNVGNESLSCDLIVILCPLLKKSTVDSCPTS